MSTESPSSSPVQSSPATAIGAVKQMATVSIKQAPSIARSMLGQSTNRDWKRIPLLTTLSLFLHFLALSAIGLIAFTTPQFVDEIFTTITNNDERFEPIAEHSLFPIENPVEVPRDEILPNIDSTDLQFENKGPIALNFGDGAPQVQAASNDVTSQLQSTATDLPGVGDIQVGNEMSGRMSAKTKGMLVKKFGGTTASEAAVVAGLNWLSAHQFPNGSWNFEHAKHPNCKGNCSQNGNLKNCPNGATGLAILTYLGAGHTHFGGDYQPQVRRGLEFLQKEARQSKTPKGLDFRGHNGFGMEGMYVQGICAIALCESAAMTRDTRLRTYAQGAIEFIVNSQNQSDGGWRYFLGQAGDTSVVGWQIMALKSANNAKMDFPHRALQGAKLFLDSAQTDRGMHYVYVPGRRRGRPEPDAAMSAVGLLCRMYLGWDRNDPQLAAGVEYLASVGP